MRTWVSGRALLAVLVLPACTRPEPIADTGGSTGAPPAASSSTTTAPSDDPSNSGSIEDTTSHGTTRGSSGSTSDGSSTTLATSTTGSSSTTGATDSTGTTGPQPATPCADGCAVEFLCTRRWRSEQACIQACEDNLDEAAAFERACEAAWEDLHACLGTLTCEQFLEWMDPAGFPYPCLRQDEVLGFECAGQ